MILLRSEVSAMFTFMLAVIPKEEKTGRNCLFVEINEGKFVFTAGSEHCMKRVILVGQPEITEIAGQKVKGKKLPEKFMIVRAGVKAFAETLKDHKSICKKLSKGDETRLFVEIDDEELVSIGDYYHYKQPEYQFKEMSQYFEQNQESVTESLLKSGDIENIMTGFSKSNIVESSYRSMTVDKKNVKLIHFTQESTGYEAVFICPSEETGKKEEGEQEEF